LLEFPLTRGTTGEKHNADEKYEDWIQIPPPPEDDLSAEAVQTSVKGDARPWTLASWYIPARGS